MKVRVGTFAVGDTHAKECTHEGHAGWGKGKWVGEISQDLSSTAASTRFPNRPRAYAARALQPPTARPS